MNAELISCFWLPLVTFLFGLGIGFVTCLILLAGSDDRAIP